MDESTILLEVVMQTSIGCLLMLALHPCQSLHLMYPPDYILRHPLRIQLVVTNKAAEVTSTGDYQHAHTP